MTEIIYTIKKLSDVFRINTEVEGGIPFMLAAISLALDNDDVPIPAEIDPEKLQKSLDHYSQKYELPELDTLATAVITNFLREIARTN